MEALLEERPEADGKFPRRIQVGPGRVAWFQSEIEEWQRSRPRGPLCVPPSDSK